MLRPASDYVPLSEATSFGAIMAAARRRGQLAIGSPRASEKTPRLAPVRTERDEFSDGDRVALIV